jgi:NTP pyrophosphatase (non-canonical NTP hydrolase)
MEYPSDANFAEARQHRAPPQRHDEQPEPVQLDDIIDTVVYICPSLSFNELRDANLARLPQFKNGKGEPAHSQPDGSDWTDSDWIMAVTGELGELANIRKKVLRGDLSMIEAKQALADELADVQIYLDILAFRLDVDLGEAVRSKFNRVSDRVGCNVKL